MASGNIVNTEYYNTGDTIRFGGSNTMFAGRVGWAGKEIWFTIPLTKKVNDVSDISCTVGSGDIYACTYNNAVNLKNLNYSIIATARDSIISVRMIFDTAPLDITDGAANIMINTSFVFTF